MATITSELRAYLRAFAPIATAVGTRVRPRKLQQNETLPAIRINLVTGQHEQNLAAKSTLAHATVQIDCYAATSEAADELAELVYQRLQGHRGTLSNVYCNGISAASNLRQFEEPVDDGGATWRYGSSRDYVVSYQHPTEIPN